MNAFDPAIFAASIGCLPCCQSHPGGCECALLIPPFDVPYVDYATAAAAIAASVESCIAYFGGGGNTAKSASFDGTTFAFGATDPGGGLSVGVSAFASVSLKAGETLSIAYSFSTDGTPAIDATMALFRCSETSPVDGDASPSSSGTLVVTAPSDGEYYFEILRSAFGGSFMTLAASATSSGYFNVNPVIAQWDDSGTTRSLWACPKLLLPPLTEASGDWYASCADAAAVLADATQVSNCVGYAGPPPEGSVTSFTAADGGTSLTLDVLVDPSPASAVNSTPAMWGGVNAESGGTLNFSFTNDAATPSVFISIYDDAGALIETLSGSSPQTSSALPYTGRYTIALSVADVTPFPGVETLTTANFVITSSGALSVNPVQARYDAGLTCAGLLDCGDSCP